MFPKDIAEKVRRSFCMGSLSLMTVAIMKLGDNHPPTEIYLHQTNYPLP